MTAAVLLIAAAAALLLLRPTPRIQGPPAVPADNAPAPPQLIGDLIAAHAAAEDALARARAALEAAHAALATGLATLGPDGVFTLDAGTVTVYHFDAASKGVRTTRPFPASTPLPATS
jgi:PAS domain-containing protein